MTATARGSLHGGLLIDAKDTVVVRMCVPLFSLHVSVHIQLQLTVSQWVTLHPVLSPFLWLSPRIHQVSGFVFQTARGGKEKQTGRYFSDMFFQNVFNR